MPPSRTCRGRVVSVVTPIRLTRNVTHDYAERNTCSLFGLTGHVNVDFSDHVALPSHLKKVPLSCKLGPLPRSWRRHNSRTPEHRHVVDSTLGCKSIGCVSTLVRVWALVM